MDDKRRKASFPALGGRVTVMQPTDGQVMSLILSTRSSRLETREIARVVRVIESLLDPDDWDRIDDALITGQMTVREFFDLAMAVVTFDWPASETEAPEPEEPKEEAPDDSAPKLL